MFSSALRAQETESFTTGFFCELHGGNEIPAITDNARGLAILRLDSAANTVHYRLTVDGISGITGVRLLGSNEYEQDRVIAAMPGMGTMGGTITGSIELTVEQADSLGLGILSIEVTSTAHPNGHIRATIIPVPNALAPTITAQQEVGHTVTGSGGSGSAILFVDEQLKAALYVVSWSGLTGPPTMAHFHRAALGANGPIVKPLTVVSGQNQIVGSWVMDDELMAALKRGEIYVNIHTATNPDGEIRGQVFTTDFYTAALEPANEVPSTAGSSNASGTAYAMIIQYPPLGGVLAVRAMGAGNTSTWMMAHVHMGARGTNGPVMQALTHTPVDQWDLAITNGRLVSLDTSALFRARGAYINLHSQNLPDGEIRGQLVPASPNLPPAGVARQRSRIAPALTARFDRASNLLQVHYTSVAGSEAGELHLVDMQGRIVQRGGVPGGDLSLPLTDVADGTYLVVLKGADGTTASTTVVILR